MSEWQDISDIISDEGRAKLYVGQTLTFSQEGSLHSYKIMRMPKNDKIWVKRINLITADSMTSHTGHDVDMSNETIKNYGGPYCRTCLELIGE